MTRRYHPGKHRELLQACLSLALAVRAQHATHANYLEYREDLFREPRWARLPLFTHRECRAYLDGMIELLTHTNIEWAHWVDGAFMPSQAFALTGRSYSEIDPEKSRHIWKGTQLVWFEPTPENK